VKPYRLLVQRLLDPSILELQWFGKSAIHPEGLRSLPHAAGKNIALVQTFWIDLEPLLAEIASGVLADEEAFRAASEFLLLRDLLSEADFNALIETLFLFLWQQAQADGAGQIRTLGPEQVSVDPDRRLVRVWFGTNRKLLEKEGVFVGFDPEQSAAEITYGQCSVFIPKSHKSGSTGSPWWRRWLLFEADDRLTLEATVILGQEDFWSSFRSTMQTWWRPGERHAFVHIHGFNVSFDEAAIRAAQIGYDLKIPGEMAFYSWPSQGAVVDYPADEASMTASVSSIARFLHEFSEQSGAERLHLFVHSMGNRGFLSALERLVAEDFPSLRLGQVFFCAPDEDVRTFEDKATKFPHASENRTILVSPEDRAVAASRWLHKYNRVGIAPPVTTVPGMETIEVRGFGLLDLGHGYFASAKPVVEDMREAIETKKRAGNRRIPRSAGNHFSIDVREAV